MNGIFGALTHFLHWIVEHVFKRLHGTHIPYFSKRFYGSITNFAVVRLQKTDKSWHSGDADFL